MAKINENELFALFEAAGVDKPTRAGAQAKDPVAKFLDNLRAQRSAFDKVDGRGGNVEAKRGDWVRRTPVGYTVKIGSSPLTIKGKTLFEVETKKDAIALLDAAEKLIQINEDLQRQITDRAKERSEKLKAARKK